MTAVVKVKVHGFNESIIVAKPVGVEAHGCEQLAQTGYAVSPRAGFQPATSGLQVLNTV